MQPCHGSQKSVPSPCSLLEESYIMKDPFSSDKAKFLVLGSQCSVCGRLVCVGPVGIPGDFLFLPHRSGDLLITRWREGEGS